MAPSGSLQKEATQFLRAAFFVVCVASVTCSGPVVTINSVVGTPRQVSPAGLCFEKISGTAYISMKGHPSDSNYAIFATKDGLMEIARIPTIGSSQPLSINKTFLDIRSRVWSKDEQGLLSFAFHPNYTTNGRLFVSYICNSNQIADCKSPCACNPLTNCTLGERNTTCNTVTIISEYSVSSPKSILSLVKTKEVRRIMAYGRPFTNHMGGEIFFGKDGYLYISSGDGGSAGDPFKFAQNGFAPLGKIFRLDINNIPHGKTYGIPPTNPFVKTYGILPEIYALGFRNPWRCFPDTVTGRIFCGDVGQGKLEEIDNIYSGYNYGWNRMEGTIDYEIKTTVRFGKLAKPLFQYSHYHINVSGTPVGGICVIGGLVYRGQRNFCLTGKYLYSDLVGTQFIGTVYPPKGESPSTIQVSSFCAQKSSFPCNSSALGPIWGWGTDSKNEAYMLSSSGTYRIAEFSRCGLVC